ncbi:MAG: MFS transporter [Ferruginibacter sp.]
MLHTTIRLYKNAYAGLSRGIWLLALVMFINRCGTMVLPFMTLYIKHIGYTTKQGGIVVAVYGMGSVLGAFLGGKISDRFGFYYTQLTSLFCGGLLFILLGQMKSYETICIVTFFLSMVNEAFRPANSSAIAYYSKPENRTQSFSLVRFSINLAWGVGSALGGLLASVSYHLLFWVDGFTNVLGSVMIFTLMKKPVLIPGKELRQQDRLTERSNSPYRDKHYLSFIFFKIIFATCFFQLFVTVPLFFKEGLHLSESQIGAVMALNGILIAMVEMVIVFKLEGRRPYLALASYGSVLMAISYAVLNLPFSNSLFVAIISTLVVTVAEMISLPFMNSFSIARSDESNRGEYAALYTMGWSTAQIIGSSSGALIANAIGFSNLWWIIASLSMITAAGFSRLQSKG